MWMNAKKILSQNTGTGKPPTKTKESAKLESFYKFIFGFAAEAVNLPEKKSKVMSSPYNANSCVVAGYIGFYGKVNNLNGENRDGCSIGLAIAAYKTKENLKFVQEANEFCAVEKVTNVACNPIIYGFPNGKAACIDRRSAEYQQATHFTSPSNGETCDGKSRLSSAEEIVKFNDKDYSNIQPREKQIAAIEADQQKEDYALTQAYLKGVLEKKDPIMQALFEKGDWNLALDEELIHIQSQFEYEIESAIKTCESDISGKHEKNQKLACDQLHRRWLFTERAIANLRDKACVKPAHYVGNYNIGEASYAQTASVKTILNKKEIDSKGTELCECPAIEVTKDEVKVPVKLVSFAKACIDAVVVPEVVPTQKCDKPQGIVDFDYDKCLCLNEKKIKSSSGNEGIFICETEVNETKCDKPEEISGFNYDKCKCDDNKKLKQPAGNDKVYECEGANWVPWSLGGLGFLAVIAFFNRNNKPKAPPVAPKTGCTNICVSGTLNSTSCACDITPLGPSCVLPKIGNLPNCACPSAPSYCTTPQKIYDVSTCQCTNVPQPPVCADSTLAPNANLTMCPKCSNGAFKTTAGCPSEGGSGNNTCAHPPCSGGLPGTGI